VAYCAVLSLTLVHNRSVINVILSWLFKDSLPEQSEEEKGH